MVFFFRKNRKRLSNDKPIPFFKLFRFATKKDKRLMVIGYISAMLQGALLPIFSVIFGNYFPILTTEFDLSRLVSVSGRYSLYFLALGIGEWFFGYIAYSCGLIAGERQAIAFRSAYFKALVQQEIGFFDSINPNELASTIAQQCVDYENGMGDKIITLFYSVGQLLSGIIVGYLAGWLLAVVITAVLPFIVISGTTYVMLTQKATMTSNLAYSKSGGIAEECMTGVRTVLALGGEEREVARYHQGLVEAKSKVLKNYYQAGLAIGLLYFSTMGAYALGFWFGAVLIDTQTENSITNDPYSLKDVLTVFFAVLIGFRASTQITPALSIIGDARVAATDAFKIMDRKPPINSSDPTGLQPENVEGVFEFKNVVFAYPTKPHKQILKGVSFKIRKNEKTALVGESGCGKTTCIQLIERFYDINEGSLTLDGNELKDLNIKWLRSKIGYVGQEPVMFASSIKENMLLAKEDATEEEIWDALKHANAADFVRQLPKQLDTYVGAGGTQLSGGQKQRLAIARAILKNPPILLLDEATSALDRKNEAEIQKTLDEISEQRTTIVIAHRLSTIQNADHIIVFDKGQIVEEGTHAELVAKQGKYYDLQKLQLGLVGTETETSIPDHKDKDADNMEVALERPSLHDVEADQETLETVEAESIPPMLVKARSVTNPAVIVGELDDYPIPDLGVFPSAISVEEVRAPIPEIPLKKKESDTKLMLKLFKYNSSKLWLLIFAIMMAVLSGIIYPFYGLILPFVFTTLLNPDSPDFGLDVGRSVIYFGITAVVALLSNFLQIGAFGHVGQELVVKLRTDLFAKYLKMDMSFYDVPENTSGALCTKLASDCAQVKTLTTNVISVYVQSISSYIAGLAIAWAASWRLGLIALGYAPISLLAGRMQILVNQYFSKMNSKDYEEAGTFIADTVNNMRTVASFGREDTICRSYDKKLAGPLSRTIRKGRYLGLTVGLTYLTTQGLNALIFYLGSIFIYHNVLTVNHLFQAFFGTLLGGLAINQMAQYAPDVGTAKTCARSIFDVLEAKPLIDIDNPSQNVKTPITGHIEFKGVVFKYPTRPNIVLRGLNLTIHPNSKVALVGPSGCGKSTVLQLLLRFYDINKGELLLDGIPIQRYDIRHLRRSLAIVFQEPILFNGTIEYNLKYARPDATDDEMRAATELANALGFIEKNEFDDPPDAKYGTGFQRMVGPKGSQISGGQKQRIAIARAILNKPNILLLDEATSALDSENEKIVQASLDRVMTGKTSIIVAHRLSTIQDSDAICVFNKGRIVEKGTYDQLVRAKGMFYNLEKGLPTE